MKSIRPLLLSGLTALITLTTPTAHAIVVYDLGGVGLEGSAGANTYSFGPANLSQGSGDSLTLANTGSGFSYFVGYFDPVTLLNVGDQIVLAFTGTFTNFIATGASSQQAFRLGFYSSGGQGVTANSASTSSATFNNYTGYRAEYNPNGSGDTTNSLLRERTGTGQNLYASASSPGLASTPSTLPLLGLSGSPFSGTFTIEKTLAGVVLTTQVNGTQTVAALDNTSAFHTFDTVSFFIQGQTDQTALTFTDLQVTTVPEPQTLALVTLAAAGLIVALRCRAIRNS